MLPLFPALAGVFPGEGGNVVSEYDSSPHSRGYFLRSHWRCRRKGLFPALAGVFPSVPVAAGKSYTLPRTRGGISKRKHAVKGSKNSSPHSRGYFQTLAYR